MIFQTLSRKKVSLLQLPIMDVLFVASNYSTAIKMTQYLEETNFLAANRNMFNKNLLMLDGEVPRNDSYITTIYKTVS